MKKVAGPVAVAAYGYDVYKDVDKYDGIDTAKATTVSIVATVIVFGIGFAGAALSAPAGAIVGSGIAGGVLLGIASDYDN